MPSPGKRIQALRKDKNLTQEQLAQELGCSKQSIYRYEKDLQQMETYILIKSALFFNVTTDFLLGLSNQKDSNKFESSDYRQDIINNMYQSINCTKFYEENYYWINKDDLVIGGQTSWAGYTEDGDEIRVIRPVIPEKVVAICKELFGSPLVINTEKDVETFLILGGHAIIRESICKKHLPEYLEPYIVESK